MMSDMVEINIGSFGTTMVDNKWYDEIKEMLMGGCGKIRAIKRHRDLTGDGLRDSKYYVDAIESGLITKTRRTEWIPEELWIID